MFVRRSGGLEVLVNLTGISARQCSQGRFRSMSEFVFSHLVYCCISSLLVVLFTCLMDLTTPDSVRIPGKYRVWLYKHVRIQDKS